MHTPDEIAAKLLAVPYEALDERAKKVARHIAARTHIARNVAKEFDAQPTPGQRMSCGLGDASERADMVAFLRSPK